MLPTPRAVLHQIITFTVCGAITSVATAQKVISLPDPTGLHAIGQASFHFVDQARPEKMTADTEDFRELNVTVWYPASPESTALATVPYLEHAEVWASLYSVDSINKMAKIKTHARPDVPPLGGGSLAVLTLSPGRGMTHWQYTILAEDLASHGWAVIVVDHTHMGRTVLGDDQLIGPHPDWDAPRELYQKSPAEIDAFWADMHEYLAADISFVLDQLSALNTHDSEHVLALRLALDCVGTIGHSRGNSPAFRTALLDSRIVACAGFDALGSPMERQGGLKKPFLNIRSDSDWTTRQPYLDQLYANVTVKAYDVVLGDFGHNACTDLEVLNATSQSKEEKIEKIRTASKYLRAFFEEVLLKRPVITVEELSASDKITDLTIHKPDDKSSH